MGCKDMKINGVSEPKTTSVSLRNGIVCVAAAVAGSAVLLTGCASLKSVPVSERRQDASYSVLLLGDTHYDTLPVEVYHSEYKARVKPEMFRNRLKEFNRNGEFWAGDGLGPRMMENAAANVVRDDTAFVLQVGDLIQGDAELYDIHKKLLADAFGYFKRVFAPLPFVTVIGNHDIRGSEADKAYRDFIAETMPAEIGKEIGGIDYYFTCGPDLYIFLNFEKPKLDVLKKALDEHPKARYKFLVTHGGVVARDNRSATWMFLGRRTSTATRAEIRDLLARHNVISLCGHTHLIELEDYFSPNGGRITQFGTCCIKDPHVDASVLRVELEGAASYGTRKSTLDTPDNKALLDEYKDGIKRYYFAFGAGSCLLRVSDSGVFVDFYAGDKKEISNTFELRPGNGSLE